LKRFMSLSNIEICFRLPRHCERSEAIHLSSRGRMDCFASLAMTGKSKTDFDVGE